MARNRTGAGGTATLVWNFFGRSPQMAPWRTSNRSPLSFGMWACRLLYVDPLRAVAIQLFIIENEIYCLPMQRANCNQLKILLHGAYEYWTELSGFMSHLVGEPY